MLYKRHVPPAKPEELIELIDKYSDTLSFLNRVSERYGDDKEGLRIINKAVEFNSNLFAGIDRDAGGSYLNGHLIPTAILGMEYWEFDDPLLIAALITHDSIEDFKKITRKVISVEIHPRVAYLVCGLSKPRSNSRSSEPDRRSRAIFQKVEHYGLECMVLKFLCDRLHNMLTLWGTPQKKLAKVQETINFVLPLMDKYDLPKGELEAAILEQLKSLHVDDNLRSRR